MELSILIIACSVCMAIALLARAIMWLGNIDYNPLADLEEDDIDPRIGKE